MDTWRQYVKLIISHNIDVVMNPNIETINNLGLVKVISNSKYLTVMVFYRR